MSTSFTPTSNWTDRTLKGRDLKARSTRPRALDLGPEPTAAPVEPRSFSPEIEPVRPVAPAAPLGAALPHETRAEVLDDGHVRDTIVRDEMAHDRAVEAAMAEATYTPAYARTRKKSGSKAWMVALPAVLVGVGVVAWSMMGTGAEEAAVADTAAAEQVALTSAPVTTAAEESLAGMPMTDLGAPAAPTPAATVQPVRRASSAPAAAPVRRAPVRTAAAAAPAAPAVEPVVQAEAEPAPAPAPTIALEPVDPAPATASEPTPVSEPIIATEPLTIPN